MFKIYTKTGDTGQTSLFGGRRISKSALRIDAYGTLDELNSFIGLLCDHLESDTTLIAELKTVQDRLFVIGSNLASDPDRELPTPDVLPADVELLELAIDRMETNLPTLRNFILPGGHRAASFAHVCRTVSRRAERLTVALHDSEPVAPIILHYLNRLSDYFFVVSRHIVHQNGGEEVTWQARS